MAFELDAGVRQQFLDAFNQGTGGIFGDRLSSSLNSVQQGIQLIDGGTPSYAMAQSTFNLTNDIIKNGSRAQLKSLEDFIVSGKSALSNVDPNWVEGFNGVNSVIDEIDGRINDLNKIDRHANRAKIIRKANARRKNNRRIAAFEEQRAIDAGIKASDHDIREANRHFLSEANTKRIWNEDGSSYRVSSTVGMEDLKTDLMIKHYGSESSNGTSTSIPEGTQYQKGSREYYKIRHERKHGNSPRAQTLDQEGVDAVVNRTKTEIQAKRDAKYQARVAQREAKNAQIQAQSQEQSILQFKANDAYERGDISSPSIDEYRRWENKTSAPGTDGTPGKLNIQDNFGPAGSVKRVSALRNQYGREANRATKEFNAGVDKILKKATDMRGADDTTPIADFIRNNEQLSREYAELQNTTFAKTRKLGDMLNTSLEDYASVEGRGDLKLSPKNKAIQANAQNGYGSGYSEVQDARTTFIKDVVGDDGITKQYQYEKSSTSIRGINENGSWGDSNISSETIGRRSLTTDANGKTVLGNLETIEASEYDEAFKIASNTDGAVKTTSQIRHVDANGNPIKVGHMEFLGDNNNVNRLAKAYDQSDVASRIAKTGAAQDSGIFRQIANAAKTHPWAAAAIAVGGFALANKALDRRKEYD